MMSDSLTENKSDLTNWFDYKNWPCQLDYVANILHKLNELNLKLQTFKENIFEACRIKRYLFKKKN